MRRRSFLSAVSVAVGGFAGCVGSLGGSDPGISMREFPERPEELTPESVTDYVATYEETRIHNYHVESGATEISVETVATLDYEADGGFHVTTQHAGTIHRDRDGERDVSELYSALIPYRVTNGSTTRLDIERVRARAVNDGVGGGEAAGSETGGDGSTDDETGSDERGTGETDDGGDTVDPPFGVRVVNVTDHPGEVTVTVVSDGGDGTPVSEVDVAAGPESAVVVAPMATAPGTYRMVARFEENGVIGEGRADVELPGVDRESNVDVLLSPDGLSTRILPAFEHL